MNKSTLTNLVRFLKMILNDQVNQPLFPVGVLITGDKYAGSATAELYLPFSNVSCSLPEFPYDRFSHSVESNGLLCGGGYAHTVMRDSCLQWSPDTRTWEWLVRGMDIDRYAHVSWTPATEIGTYLMGGVESLRTTTLVKPDGTHEPGFHLQYETL